MKNKVAIEAQIHQIKEGISQIKNLLYCMDKFIKEIEKGLDENNDEKIDKIVYEDAYKKLDKGMEVLYNEILWWELDDHEARIRAMWYIWDINQELKGN